jgi:hypothetical protein
MRPQSHTKARGKLGCIHCSVCAISGLRQNPLQRGFGRRTGTSNPFGQAVKKLHLGVASSGYCPCPHRVPTVSPPCPHRVPTVSPPCPHRAPTVSPLPTSTLPDGWLGRRFSILRIVPVKDALGDELALLNELSLAPFNRNKRQTRFCYGHLPRFLLLAKPMLRNQTKSSNFGFVLVPAPL